MYSKRSSRLGQLSRLKRAADEAAQNDGTYKPPSAPKSRREMAAEKNKKYVPQPYESVDVREAFADIIKIRSGGKLVVGNHSVSPHGQSSADFGGGKPTNTSNHTLDPSVQPTVSSAPLNSRETVRPVVPSVKSISVKRELEHVCAGQHLTVVNYSMPWCKICQDLKPSFEDLAKEYDIRHAEFVCVDGEDGEGGEIHDDVEPIIGAYPTFIFYMKGQVVHRMQGFDVTELRTRVNNFTRLLPSSFFMSSINDIDEDEDDFYEYDDGPDHCAPEKPKVEVRHQFVTAEAKTDDGDFTDDVLDISAALEEACGELNYTEEEMEDFLSTGKYPEELVQLIMAKTGCDEKPRVVEAMGRERKQLLEKIKTVIAQKHRLKSEAEAKVQAKLKRIGRCPMNFEWIKMPGGYRCAGGSHWVDDSQVNIIEE